MCQEKLPPWEEKFKERFTAPRPENFENRYPRVTPKTLTPD